jgi:hypothetical protein
VEVRDQVRLTLAVSLVVEVAIYWLGQGDFLATDPLWYADLAHHLAVDPSHAFVSNHPFEMRVGLTVPLAILYRVFGASPFVTNLPCLFAALGIVAVAWAAPPTPRGKLFACVFAVTLLPLVHHAILLNVDLPAAALMAWSILLLSRRRFVPAMVVWFAAFLVKETALWCAPVWIWFAVRESGWRVLWRAAAVGAALGIAYLVLCAVVWGDPLARFKGVEELTYEHKWALSKKPASEWLARLTWEVPWLLVKMFKFLLVPAVLAPWLVRGRERIWLVYTATIILLFWFGSSSFSGYEPLPIIQRMIVPVMPGVLIVAALASDAAIERFRLPRWLVPAAVGAIAVMGALSITRRVLLRDRPETAAYAALRAEVADPSKRFTLVCGDPRCEAISNYYFDFAPPPNLKVAYGRGWTGPDGSTVRALVNMTRAAGARETNQDLSGPIEALQLPRLASHEDVRLYDAGDGARLYQVLH